MAYTPTTRPPTGAPAAPLIMVSGVPKSGKSTVGYRLAAATDLIARTFVVDLGEGSADEYADLGPYELVDWGGSWTNLADSVDWCVRQTPPAGLLNAVVIDSGTEIWEGLKDRAARRARSSKRAKDILKSDPDAEIDVTMTYWNDAAAAWARIVNPLRLSPTTVGVVLVRADEVAEIGGGGAPTGRKTISYQAHKSMQATATAHVEVRREDHSAWLVDVRSNRVEIPRNGLRLDADNPLADLVTRMAGGATFAAPVVVVPVDTERVRTDDGAHDGGPSPDEGEAIAVFEAIKALGPDRGRLFGAHLDQVYGANRQKLGVPSLMNATWRGQVAAALDEWVHQPDDSTEADEAPEMISPSIGARLDALEPAVLAAVVADAGMVGIGNVRKVPTKLHALMHDVIDQAEARMAANDAEDRS